MAEDDFEILGFSIKTTARALECSDRTVWNLIDRGDLRIFKVGKKSVRVIPQDVREIAAKATSRPKALA